jgi:hypothetical protein
MRLGLKLSSASSGKWPYRSCTSEKWSGNPPFLLVGWYFLQLPKDRITGVCSSSIVLNSKSVSNERSDYTPKMGLMITAEFFALILNSYKYCDLALDVAGFSTERAKYDREFCGTSTREWLFWQGPEEIVQVNYRPILSSEKVSHIKKTAIVKQAKIWSWSPDRKPTIR